MLRTPSLACVFAMALTPLSGCADLIRGTRTTSRTPNPTRSHITYQLQETAPLTQLHLEGTEVRVQLRHLCQRQLHETYQDLHIQHYDNANAGLSWALGLSGVALAGAGTAGLLGAYDSLSDSSVVDYGAIGALVLGGVMLTGAVIDAARSTRSEASSEEVSHSQALSPEACPPHISSGYGQVKVSLMGAEARAIPLGTTDTQGRFHADLAAPYASLKQHSQNWGQPVFLVLESPKGSPLERLPLDERTLFAGFLDQHFQLALARCEALHQPDACEALSQLSQPSTFAHQAHAQAKPELYAQARALLARQAEPLRTLKAQEVWQRSHLEHHLIVCLESEHDSADELESACQPLLEALPLLRGSPYEARVQAAVSESRAYLQAYRAFEAESEAQEAEDPYRPRRRYVRRKPYVYQPAQYRRGESTRSQRGYSSSSRSRGGGRGGGGRR